VRGRACGQGAAPGRGPVEPRLQAAAVRRCRPPRDAPLHARVLRPGHCGSRGPLTRGRHGRRRHLGGPGGARRVRGSVRLGPGPAPAPLRPPRGRRARGAGRARVWPPAAACTRARRDPPRRQGRPLRREPRRPPVALRGVPCHRPERLAGAAGGAAGGAWVTWGGDALGRVSAAGLGEEPVAAGPRVRDGRRGLAAPGEVGGAGAGGAARDRDQGERAVAEGWQGWEGWAPRQAHACNESS